MKTPTHGSDQRPPRDLEAPFRLVDVHELAERLRSEPAFASDGRDSQTIFHAGPARLIVTVLEAERDIGPEHGDDHVALQLVDGVAEVSRGGDRETVTVGSVVMLAGGSRWTLRASEPCVVVAYFWAADGR